MNDLVTKLVLGQFKIVTCHTVNIEDSEGVDDGSECALSGSRFFILAGDVLDMLSRKWKQTELLSSVR